jgi:hypothetical protein
MGSGDSSADHRGRGKPVDGGSMIVSERLSLFKRIYRWLNLTLVHHGIWPLAALWIGGPTVAVADLPWDRWGLRVLGPALAALLAALVLLQRPVPGHADAMAAADPPAPPRERTPLQTQVVFLLIGLPLMLALVRIAAGPPVPAARLIAFGLADALAFQLIHFGVVERSFGHRHRGADAALLLFAASWALRDVILAALEGGLVDYPLTIAGGLGLGLAIAAISRGLRRWPGGFAPAVGAQWLIVTLVFGFL